MGGEPLKKPAVAAAFILAATMAATFAWAPSGMHKEAGAVTAVQGETAYYAEPVQPIPMRTDLDENKVELGEKLFHDVRLSGNDTISCVHCHDLEAGGVDGLPRSIGINGQEGEINAPTVYNSSLNLAQFWDGRAATLEEQIDGPMHNPREMGAHWPDVVAKLRRDQEYSVAFTRLYKEGVTEQTIKDAIATFERSLTTPNSRFDRFLRGEEDAISAEERAGYGLFKSYGCAACHQGANVGGNMFHVFGVMKAYFDKPDNVTRADLGRFNVTGREEDRHYFRVPSLRLAALTRPYFHDASAKTLEQAIAEMAEHQLDRKMPSEHVALIAKFLRTLPGEYKGKPLQ